MKKYIIIIIIGLLSVCSLSSSVLQPQETEVMKNLLEDNDMSLQSLNFLKDWARDTKLKLPIVVDILNNPLHFPGFVDSNDELCTQHSPKEIIYTYADILYQASWINSFDESIFMDYWQRKVKKPEDLVGYVQYIWEFTDFFYQKAWEKVSNEEKDMLSYLSYSLWMEEQDSLKYDAFYSEHNIIKYDSLSIEDDVIPIIKKIDFSDLMYATAISQMGFDILEDSIATINFTNKKRIIQLSKWGDICIGTTQDDRYKNNYACIIDPAGDDFYKGDISTDWARPFYWYLDLEGNDTYRNQGLGGLLHSFAGIGILYDRKGDDIYQGDDYTLSSFFGYNLLCDQEGYDVYEGGLNSIAAGTFGLSVLIDEKGNDKYSTTELGEGFGGPLGAGLLIDVDGSDLYYAGGKYLHAPLAPFDHRALSQGFGFGVRPYLVGGIGLLFDQAGNDVYQGAVYSQAVAYWYALGIIIDKSGNDFYTAVYYPQGSGIHLAGGFLYDEEGEDHYYSKHGPGQGAAHDYAVGYLIDRKGNDIYSVEGGNGLGLTNSVALFLDVSGNDRYERNITSNYGYANSARNTGSIGIFLDTAGDDLYPISADTSGFHERYKNDTQWTYGTYGVGKDTNMVVLEAEPMEQAQKKEVATVDSLATIKELFSIASEWGVGSSAKRVAKAAEILLQRDEEAAEYIFMHKMDTKASLEYRAISNYAKESKVFSDYVPRALTDEDSVTVRNAIALIGEIKDSTMIDTLLSVLSDKRYELSVLSTLGDIGTKKSIEILKRYMNSPSEKIRVVVARGFLKIDAPESMELLGEMKDDPSFLIRTMYKLKQK